MSVFFSIHSDLQLKQNPNQYSEAIMGRKKKYISDTFHFNTSISQIATNVFSLSFKQRIIEQYKTQGNCVFIFHNL